MKIVSREQVQRVGECLLLAEIGSTKLNSSELQWMLQCLRLDPRICELAVHYFAKNWSDIHPMELRKLNSEQDSPAALAVLLEQTLNFGSIQDKKIFREWMNLVTFECPKGNNEQFFIGVYPINSSLMRENAENPYKIFLKWGFFERNLFLNKALQKTRRITLATQNRRDIVKQDLFTEGRSFTVEDYRQRVDAPLSRRQAERDLKDCGLFVARGFTRGRTYRPKKRIC